MIGTHLYVVVVVVFRMFYNIILHLNCWSGFFVYNYCKN